MRFRLFLARSSFDDGVSLEGSFEVEASGVLKVHQSNGRHSIYGPTAWLSVEHDEEVPEEYRSLRMGGSAGPSRDNP